jgi:hypothetical protein
LDPERQGLEEGCQWIDPDEPPVRVVNGMSLTWACSGEGCSGLVSNVQQRGADGANKRRNWHSIVLHRVREVEGGKEVGGGDVVDDSILYLRDGFEDLRVSSKGGTEPQSRGHGRNMVDLRIHLVPDGISYGGCGREG